MHKPFEILEQWVKQGRIRLSAPVAVVQDDSDTMDEVEDQEAAAESLPANLPDEQLFEFAMKDVKALGWSAVPLTNRPPLELAAHDLEAEALRELENFIRHGNIEMEHSPEYIEGTVQPHGKVYLNDLRSGRFSVQAHLDLHGLILPEARFVVDEFILEAVKAGFTCVRVVHGRGKHSHKHHSVLKENIQRWLASRRMSRHVIAYTSARVCDGGGGAVYVLLRR